MADLFQKLPFGTQSFQGYKSNAENAPPSYLSQPSVNCLVTEDGKVVSRFGFNQEFSIGNDGFTAKPFYHPTYDIAFFANDTKVYYRDIPNNVTYDTGITLTTGTTTRFDEFFGDVYFSNTTDGIYRIMVSRLNGAVSAGASTITLDVDGAARLSVFGDTSGNIRINGTNEAYNAVNVSTGALTLTGTASQAYADNTVAIFIDGPYSSLEKPSKILFWKSRMHIMGFPSATNADQPNNTVMAGQFVIGQTGASGIENIIDFTFGTGGSTKITVGGGGKVTNILGASDYLYFFTQNRVFATAASNIFTDGASIGLTIPDEKDLLHGCLNEDSATLMGNNAIGYITNDKRFMRIPIDTDTGAPLSAPEEDFDVDIRDHLRNMDDDQTGALMHHYRGGRQTLFQVRISGQWYLFIFDHNIIRQTASGFVRGAWQPPQLIPPMTGFYERNGVLFGVDSSDDSVYSFFTSFDDNGTPISVTIATPEFNIGQAMLKNCQAQGEINQPSDINMNVYVWNENGGKRTGSTKHVLGSSYSYSSDLSVGALPVGGGISAGETTQIAKWKKEFPVFPSEGHTTQFILTNEIDGGYISLTSFSLSGQQYADTFAAAI